MRYLIALSIAGLIIATLAVFAWLTIRAFEERMRESLREQKQAGQLPAHLQNVDLESADIWKLMGDVKVKLPHDLLSRLSTALFIAKLWYVWAPAIMAVCLAIAGLLGHLRRGGEKRP